LLRFSPNCGWRSGWDGFSAGLLAACLIASLAWSGHGGAGSGPLGEVQLAADALHLVGAGGWIGGLPPLLLLLAFARRTDAAMAAAAARRFARFALVSVGVLVA